MNELNDVISGKVRFSLEKVQNLLFSITAYADRNGEILFHDLKKEYREDKKRAVANIQKTQNGYEAVAVNFITAGTQSAAAYFRPNDPATTTAIEKCSTIASSWIQSRQEGYRHEKDTLERQEKELSDSIEKTSGQRQQILHQIKEADTRLFDALSKMI